jgi:hypothetical protein
MKPVGVVAALAQATSLHCAPFLSDRLHDMMTMLSLI